MATIINKTFIILSFPILLDIFVFGNKYILIKYIHSMVIILLIPYIRNKWYIQQFYYTLS